MPNCCFNNPALKGGGINPIACLYSVPPSAPKHDRYFIQINPGKDPLLAGAVFLADMAILI